MKLLFITQKLHQQDAFGLLWVRAFMAQGYTVKVICLEDRRAEGAQALGEGDTDIIVHSLGKEKGYGKIRQILNFWSLIMTLKYDRVFIHMSPVWYALGWKWWFITRKPCYLWYTHYQMQLGVWLFGLFGKRFFCATEQSLPQYTGSPKKIVTGHGIDLSFWTKRPNIAPDPHKLLVVHRLSRSKRLEIILHAMKHLPEYTLDIYGIEAEADYTAEMKALAKELQIDDRVTFRGTASAKDLPAIYCAHRLILNMASETIDKTMLEAMTCGCYPVTTRRNADAIGISKAPDEDAPEALEAFIRQYGQSMPMTAEAMYDVVAERHSLAGLIMKMDAYIRSGT